MLVMYEVLRTLSRLMISAPETLFDFHPSKYLYIFLALLLLLLRVHALFDHVSR